MTTTYCLDCDHTIRLDKHTGIGTIVECSYCESEFQVIDIDPIELDWLYDGAYDWDEEDEEDEEDDREAHSSWKITKRSRHTEWWEQDEQKKNRNKRRAHQYGYDS